MAIDPSLLSPESITKQSLTPLVFEVLDSKTAEIQGWSYAQLYGAGGGAGDVITRIYRIKGNARDGGQLVDWSLVLKILGATTGKANPSEPRYWKREILAFQSGKLEGLPTGLRAPRCFGIEEKNR